MILPFSFGVLLVWVSSLVVASEECPGGCYCHPLKSFPVPDAMLPFGHTLALKVNCHALADSESRDIFSQLPENTVHLDLAKYGLKVIGREDFVGVSWMEKLDLQGNQISDIQEGAFIPLKYLQVLDLSRNKLTVISSNMFKGLVRLSRLKLNDNSISRMEKGSFDHLSSLAKLELADNQFLCDCHMSWFLDYMDSFKDEKKGSPLANPLRIKCALPIHLAEVPLKRLRKESLLNCHEDDGGEEGSPPSLTGKIQISPEEDIIAFKGDVLKIVCEIKVLGPTSSDDAKIFWNLKGKSVSSYSWSNISVNEEYTSDAYRSILTVHDLDVVHSGNWLCRSRTASSPPLDVLVISSTSRTCTQTLISHTVKGDYEWKPSLGGHTQRLPCEKPLPGTLGFAYRLCRENGEWAREVNISQCAYTSAFTDSLRKFALMNTSTFDRASLFESAAVLRNFTSLPTMFKDVSDLNYFAKAVDNYVPFMDAASSSLADVITDMIANILGVAPELLLEGEKEKGVVTKLRNVLMNITSISPRYSYHKKGVLVVSTIPQAKDRIACSWSEDDYECFEKKDAESYSYKNTATLVSAEFEADPARQPLRIVAFGNASLFISKDQEEESSFISSYVLGIWSTHKSGNTSVKVSLLAKSKDMKYIEPVTWNGERWISGVCSSATIIRVNQNALPQFTFSCPMTGFFALKGIPGRPFRSFDELGESSSHQSVSHFGSVPILLTLIILIAVYGSLPLYTVSKKLKVCLLNLWISSAALVYFFVGGTYLTEDDLICSFVGILLHFTTLSTLMWFFVSITTLYTKVSSRREDKRSPSHLFLPSSSSMCTTRQSQNRFWFLEKRSFILLRYYLLGWGLPILLTLISGAADLSSYRSEYFCFMKTSTFLGLLIVPWALISSLIAGYSLSIYCLLHSPPSHITEHTAPSQLTDHHSEDKCSVVSLSNDFGNAKGLLRALLLSFALFTLTWASAACSVVCPISNNPQIEGIVFAVLYVTFGILYAFFNAAYYAFARRELGAQCLSLFRRDELHHGSSGVNDRDELLVVPTLYKSETDYGYLMPGAPPPSAADTFKEPSSSVGDYAANNVSHLRRGYVAPVNSEAEYSSTFAAIRKDNPRTSSPAPGGSMLHYPQGELGGLSPLYNETESNNNNNNTSATTSANNHRSMNSVVVPEEYTECSTIKMGDPCKLFSMSQAGLPPESYSSLPRNSSVSRRQKRYRRYRSNTAIDDDEDEDAQSRSTVYSGGKSNGSKKRSRRPHRRRPRATKEKTLDQVPEVLNSSQYSSSELNKRETSV